MDGFLSFTPLFYDTYVQISNTDIIAPLWTDLDMYTRGNVSYEQATSGPLLQTATNEMNRTFPGFSASWVFVATWEKMEFEPDVGVTFQVVLVSDVQGRTFILMNYGPIPAVDPEPWKAGLQTQENYQNFTIQVPLSGLTTSTNVGIPGRWAFQVSGATFGKCQVFALFFPVLPGAVRAVTYDGGNALVQLTQPFSYFGRDYTQLYVSKRIEQNFKNDFRHILLQYLTGLSTASINMCKTVKPSSSSSSTA
uniref:NIDO domain-containing protein n=1 Tax=Pygocentrus nattereri TaxID=42514 RepID=A0A3B4DB55_PYGNA